MVHRIKKEENTHYTDYRIEDGKFYLIEEYENREKTTFVCKTKHTDDSFARSFNTSFQENTQEVIITIDK